MSKSDLSTSLIETLKNSDLQSAVAAVADALTDTFAEEGLAKDLPVIGTIVSLTRFGRSVQDRLFAKKLLRFLSELKSVPPRQRDQMISKIDQSGKFRVEVGEKLLCIVDACEDHAAASIVGQLFLAFLQEKLNYDEFLRASRACRMVGTEDFMFFVGHADGTWGLEEAGEFVSAGLLYLCEPEIDLGHISHRGSMVKGMKPMLAKSSSLGSKIRGVLESTFTKPTPT